MATIPCPIPCITCEPPPPGANGLGLSPNDPSYPFVNFSSEAPDVDLFLGRRYGGQLPPLGSTWYAVGCLGFCLSTESQDDADVCAENQVALCQSVSWPVPNPVEGATPSFVPRDLFTNNTQQCSFTCPDGNLYTFTVAAGYFLAFSVAAANSLASSYACRQARLNRICFGSMQNSRSCLEGSMFSSISVSSANLPVTFDIVSGAPPPGTSPVQTSPNALFIIGTPTMAGDYPIRVRATDRFGNFMEKDFQMVVFGITNDSELPDAITGEEYSVQLNYAGTPTSAVEFTLNGGSFPDGITMDSSGLISGTPTVDGAFQVTIGASDSFEECDKTFDLFVESISGINWNLLQWGSPTINTSLGGSVSGTAAGGIVDVSIDTPNVAPDSSFASILFDQDAGSTSPIVYSGSVQNCNARLTVSGESLVLQPFFSVSIWTGPDYSTIDTFLVGVVNGGGDGVFDFPFSVPAGLVNIWVSCSSSSATPDTDPGRSGSYNVEITNVP